MDMDADLEQHQPADAESNEMHLCRTFKLLLATYTRYFLVCVAK